MSIFIEQHLQWMRAAGLSAITIHDRERLLRYADNRFPIDNATTEEIIGFLAAPRWAGWTRATYFGHLAGFYRWATRGDYPYLDWNPMSDLMRPRSPDAVPHPATDEQLRIALARSPWPWAMAVTLAAYAGFRSGECIRVHREHIRRDTLTIVSGKGNRTHILPTHPAIWTMVRDRPDGLLIRNAWGNPLNLTRQAAHFRGVGLPGVHLHMFRHWHACELLRHGVDIRTVQSLMRHRSLETTAMYLQVVDTRRTAAIEMLRAPIELPDEGDLAA